MKTILERARAGECLADLGIIDMHGHVGRYHFPIADLSVAGLLRVMDRLGVKQLFLSHIQCEAMHAREGNDELMAMLEAYPDRLMGDEIPRLARILHVADAFEAMTADRPYRKALSHEQALAELRRFAGIQFDPEMVDAFVRTPWAEDVRDPGRPNDARPIPLLAQHAARAAGGAFDGPTPGSPAADLV